MTPNGSYGMAAERVEKSEKLKNTNIKKAKKSDMSETIKSVIFLEGRKVCQFFFQKDQKVCPFFPKGQKVWQFFKMVEKSENTCILYITGILQPWCGRCDLGI